MAKKIGRTGHTHVVLVLAHGGHGVLVGAELHVSLSCQLAVESDVDVDTQRVQR